MHIINGLLRVTTAQKKGDRREDDQMSTLSYTEICNAPWMYVFVVLIILGCCLHSFIFARRAWKHGLEIGLTAQELRQPLTTGIAISVFPTIPVVITMIGLIPLLGAPLPWLRLSVIGGAAAEAMSANAGVEAVGEVLEVGGYTINGWIAAAYIMCFSQTTAIIFNVIFTKPISKLYEGGKTVDTRLPLAIGTGCLLGVMGYATINFGLGAISTNGVIFGVSFLVGAVMVVLAKKMPKQKWMKDALMAVAMIIAMIVAVIIF